MTVRTHGNPQRLRHQSGNEFPHPCPDGVQVLRVPSGRLLHGLNLTQEYARDDFHRPTVSARESVELGLVRPSVFLRPPEEDRHVFPAERCRIYSREPGQDLRQNGKVDTEFLADGSRTIALRDDHPGGNDFFLIGPDDVPVTVLLNALTFPVSQELGTKTGSLCEGGRHGLL
ncbi:hypothetical protein D9M69_584260 [compost metagenome]